MVCKICELNRKFNYDNIFICVVGLKHMSASHYEVQLIVRYLLKYLNINKQKSDSLTSSNSTNQSRDTSDDFVSRTAFKNSVNGFQKSFDSFQYSYDDEKPLSVNEMTTTDISRAFYGLQSMSCSQSKIVPALLHSLAGYIDDLDAGDVFTNAQFAQAMYGLKVSH